MKGVTCTFLLANLRIRKLHHLVAFMYLIIFKHAKPFHALGTLIGSTNTVVNGEKVTIVKQKQLVMHVMVSSCIYIKCFQDWVKIMLKF